MTARFTWTPNETDRLQEMKAVGKSNAQIAAALNKSVHAVRAKTQSLGLRTKPVWTEADDERVRELWPATRIAHGGDARRIGKALNPARTAQAVMKRASKLGLRRAHRGRPPTRHPDARRLSAVVSPEIGAKIERLAEARGISMSEYVRRIVVHVVERIEEREPC